MLAPFLQEIGIALGLVEDARGGGGLEGHAQFRGRHLQRGARGLRVERADEGEVEQALGIGLGASHLPGQLRQARAHQHHRHLLLRAAMQRGDQRGQLLLLHVLQFVDEHHQRGAAGLGRAPRGFQQRLQVVLQVAVVGQARFGLQVDADLDIGVLELEAAREAGQRAQRATAQFARLLRARQPQQGLAQLRGEDGRQRSAFRGLDAQRMQPRALGVVAHAVEQHGLADPAQSDHEHALGVAAGAHALAGDVHGAQQFVATGQFRRRRARAGSIGIGDRIHDRRLGGLSEITRER